LGKNMTIEFLKKLRSLEESKELDVLQTFGATKTYNNFVRHIVKNTQVPEGYLQIVKPRDPDYDTLPSNIYKSENKLVITKEGLEFVREEFFAGSPIRGIAKKSIQAVTLAFNAMQDEE
jgi:hypothetical protein